MDGSVECEGPNNAIYKFEGKITLNLTKAPISCGIDNFMLRGCALRNTEYIIGVAVYQGHDSKIMMNSEQAKYKFSQLEKLTNKAVYTIFVMQMILALVGGFVGARWNTTNYTVVNYLKKAPGPNDKPDEGQQSFSYYLVQYFGTWLLIFTNFVPISLTVTLEVVKFWHAMFMGMDHTMYDPEQDVGMKA